MRLKKDSLYALYVGIAVGIGTQLLFVVELTIVGSAARYSFLAAIGLSALNLLCGGVLGALLLKIVAVPDAARIAATGSLLAFVYQSLSSLPVGRLLGVAIYVAVFAASYYAGEWLVHRAATTRLRRFGIAAALIVGGLALLPVVLALQRYGALLRY